uniref:ORF7a protein n=1 Tax=Bat Coronavirus EsYN20 TaxID=3018828 RepID=A0AA49EE54_9NIDO|nr:ORF7a protein [Bat Coronavirus EsYN20]
MYFLIFVLALLASADTFRLEIQAQSYCISSDLNYCYGLVEPCNGVLVAVNQPRNLTLYMCVNLSGVQQRDLGVKHVFTLLDPFGQFICSHRAVNGSLRQVGWGTRYVTFSVLSRGFGVKPLSIPDLCSGGVVIRTRSSFNIVMACVSFPGWHWDDTFRYYSLEPTDNCNLQVRPLTRRPHHYYPTQKGVFAQPIKDEL